MLKKLIGSTLAAMMLVMLIAAPTVGADDENVTRGEFIQAFMGALGVHVDGYENLEGDTFTDVPEELEAYVTAALRLELTNGVSETHFAPDRHLTREQTYVFMERALNLLHEYDTDVLGDFTDYNQVSDWSKHGLAAAADLGLMNGYPDGTIRPDHSLTEPHMELIIDRFMSNFDRVSMVGINDQHGRILSDADNGHMGMAKIATVYDQVKDMNDEAFLFDLGDTFHGTNPANFTEGESVVSLMNAMEYDAMVVGNHDFNFGSERLLELIDMADFPVMSGNVTYEDSGELIAPPAYTVVEAAGKDIALISITAEDTTVKTAPDNIEGLSFEFEVPALERLVDEVRDDVDHIFVLSHSGYLVEQDMAAVDGVDLILGGHSHTTLEFPVLHDGTYVSQAWEYGKAASVNHVLLHDGELVGVSGHLVRDSESLEERADIRTMLDDVEAELAEVMEEVVANIDVDLNGDRADVRTKETNLGNLITDAFRDRLGTDVAINNGGGIRASIGSGDVTRGDVVTAFIFANIIQAVDITGEDLVATLERGVHEYPEQAGGFLHVSGMTYEFDPAADPYERITEVMIDGEPLDPDATYSLATNEFLIAGGDGYQELADSPMIQDSGLIEIDILIEYLQDGKPIPEVEGRISMVE